MSKIQVTLQDYHDLLEKGLVDKTAVYEIRSQDDLNHQGRDSEVLISAIDELEKTKKQLEIALKALKPFACEKLVFKTNEGIEYTLQGKFQNSSVAINALNKIKELDK